MIYRAHASLGRVKICIQSPTVGGHTSWKPCFSIFTIVFLGKTLATLRLHASKHEKRHKSTIESLSTDIPQFLSFHPRSLLRRTYSLEDPGPGPELSKRG